MLENLLNKLLVFGTGVIGFKAYALIIGMLTICGLGVPIPEDITLVLAGFLAGQGNISLIGALIVGFVGVLIGDTFLFFLGRHFGYKVFKFRLIKKIFGEKRLQKAKDKVHSNSKFICFTARFLPGLRAPIYLVAGAMKVSPLTFLFFDGTAALLSVPIWVLLGWSFKDIDVSNFFDSEAMVAFKSVQHYFLLALAVLILVYVGYRFFKKRKKSLNP